MSTTLFNNCFRLKYNIAVFKFTNLGPIERKTWNHSTVNLAIYFFDIEVDNNVYSIRKVIKSDVRKTINYYKGFRNKDIVLEFRTYKEGIPCQPNSFWCW